MTENLDSNNEPETSQNLAWKSNDPCITREEYMKGNPEERKRMVEVIYEWYMTENPYNCRDSKFWNGWEDRVWFDPRKGYLRLSGIVPPMPLKELDLWYQGMAECMEYEEGDEF